MTSPAVENSLNVAFHLTQMARTQPDTSAIQILDITDKRKIQTTYTFKKLDELSDQIARGLSDYGICAGQKTMLLVPAGIDFFCIIFALFKLGAIPVVVDPGMGVARMMKCFSKTRPTAFIGISKAHLLRYVFPKTFRSVTHFVSVGKKMALNTISYSTLMNTKQPIAFTPYIPKPNETCAILFTSGSTGPAKGVCYTHEIFNAQIRHIQKGFHIEPKEVDCPTFPLFALFNPALGMTAVLPDMNTSAPIKSDPQKIIDTLLYQHVTSLFASPALIGLISNYAIKENINLPDIRRIISAGAPVLPDIVEKITSRISDNAILYSGYGATEAMPICKISSREILSETAEKSKNGLGTCVGKPLDGIETEIISISDDVIAKMIDTQILPLGEIGEIIVRGDTVTRDYYANETATQMKNITDGNIFWHRMGDVGWKDTDGRIWFCGRKNHRVEMGEKTFLTIPVESIFNAHPFVKRSALVGIVQNNQTVPLVCIEPQRTLSKAEKKRLTNELFEVANAHTVTNGISLFLYKKNFPVDVRHNAKIFREKLAVWAQKKMKTQ